MDALIGDVGLLFGLLFAAIAIVLGIVPAVFVVLALSHVINAVWIAGWLKHVRGFPEWKGGPAEARPHVRRAFVHLGLAALCSALAGVAGTIARWAVA